MIGGVLISALGGAAFRSAVPPAPSSCWSPRPSRLWLSGLSGSDDHGRADLIAIGYARLGVYIKYIPYSVTIGFTAGVAVIIFTSQIKDCWGCA